jgi:RNA polymerase sigma-70 factor, ECF subfamily
VANRDKRAPGTTPMRLLNPQSLTGHADTLLRAAWALCGTREEAEDLVQETFARVLARPRLLRGEGSDLAYLLRALRNTFMTGRRDVGRLPVSTTTLDEVSVADPRPVVSPESAFELGELYDALAGLPEHYRLALVAVDLVGLSYREAGDALGVREATLTTRLFRARRLLARQFTGEPAAEPRSVGKGTSEGGEAEQLAQQQPVNEQLAGGRSSTRPAVPVGVRAGAAPDLMTSRAGSPSGAPESL